MNCKPGDLAVIVNAHPEAHQILGRFIRLTISIQYEGEPCWQYEDMPMRGKCGRSSWTWHEYPDAWLRPIRDPGDDATDETLQWLPVPLREKETA